eukprot:749192_1
MSSSRSRGSNSFSKSRKRQSHDGRRNGGNPRRKKRISTFIPAYKDKPPTPLRPGRTSRTPTTISTTQTSSPTPKEPFSLSEVAPELNHRQVGKSCNSDSALDPVSSGGHASERTSTSSTTPPWLSQVGQMRSATKSQSNGEHRVPKVILERGSELIKDLSVFSVNHIASVLEKSSQSEDVSVPSRSFTDGRQFKALLFHADVLYTDTHSIHEKAWTSALQEHFGDFDFSDVIKLINVNAYCDQEAMLYIERVIEPPHEFTEEDSDLVIVRKNEIYAQLCANDKRVMTPGMRELLVRLKDNRWKMAVLHTGGRQRCNLDVKGIGLRNFFHICVNATALMNLRRPYTDMFIESMNRMKAHPNQTLFICSNELAAMDALSADVTPILISPTSRQSSFIGRYFSISSEVSGCTEHLQSMLLDHLRTLDTPHECQTFRV